MAAKKRDYKAEERRRNELARERGFKTRAQQRAAQKRGEVKLKRAGKSYQVQRTKARTSSQPKRTKRQKTYRDKVNILGYPMSKKQMSADYSSFAARTEMAQYQPERAKDLGITPSAYTEAYYDAFVNPDSNYAQHRYDDGGSDAMFYWFVELNGYFEADEYDDKYGNSAN